jgi:hypothetical protein
MKTVKAFLILTSLLFCLYACKKDNNPGSVVGKWNIVSVETGGVSHAGQPGDYYEFNANGTLDIKGGTIINILNYTMSAADSTIDLTFPGNPQALPEFGRITTFNAHSLVINGPYPITPGGNIDAGNSISLSR